MDTEPTDIRQKQFKIKFRGFDIHEVDAYLEKIAETVQALQSETLHNYDQIEMLKDENTKYKDREENFRQIMLNSEKIIAEMKKKCSDLCPVNHRRC
jgi:cell division initiation protein